MTNLDILSEWYRRVWIEGDLSAIDSFFAPSGGAEGILPSGCGKQVANTPHARSG